MKNSKLLSTLAVALWLGGLSLVSAGDIPQRTLLALSKRAHTLAVVDPVSLKVLYTLPVGPDPHEVIATADGKTAYVSNMGQDYHEIDVLDLAGQKALPSIDIFPLISPHGLDFAQGKVWFTAQGSKAIARLDPATQKVDWIMGTGQDFTHMIYVTPDAQHIYASNKNSGTISLFELVQGKPFMPPKGSKPPKGIEKGPNGPRPKPQKQWEQTLVPVAEGSEGFDVSPDGRELWTASGMNGTVSIIDLKAKKVVQTLEGATPGANRLKFTPDGQRVFVSSLGDGNLTVLDVASRKVLQVIPLGNGAAGIQMDGPDGRAFIGCTGDDTVAVVDLKTLKVISRLDVGGNPDGLAMATLR